MRQWIDLFEQKWWDTEPTIRLFHGTSSALLETIRTDGLMPPQKSLNDFARDVLEEYVPQDRWTPALLDRVDKEAARHFGGRAGESGRVIFCMTHMDGPKGYAESLCQHGGEIARDVYHIASDFYMEEKFPNLRDEVTYLEYKKLLDQHSPIKPRYVDAHPAVIEMLVPKEWCAFYNDLERMKAGVQKARDEGRPWAIDDPIEQVYDEVFENREVRITQTVPPEMIVNVREFK